ncbi:MAG TPA: DUF305 domain-containing protein [Acidimicrobiales bacterium]|nr:DUF305 domain-containing protein [Acidimicrobiales bacterium]
MRRIALTLFLGLALAACSDKAEDHNAQDVSFAQEMIPHHQQAVEMSDMALAQATSPKVKDLATRIKSAQGPEIQTMKGWLSTWGEPEAPASDDQGGMHHGGGGSSSHTGMMTDAQMTELRAATGMGFDRMFLTMMIEHHRGAVQMSQTELDDGKYGPAKELAQTIIDAQQKEINEMQELLAGGL